ncbi:MAG TPA: hypothetical protein VFE32_21345 [Puia sp.]|jgi:hypothetical protein|nr:hypothetical protein [Puia sp.]
MRPGKAVSRLTEQKLNELKKLGYQFVLVKGYTPERGADFIGLNYFTLLPVKKLPEDPGEKEIYAPIDDEILSEWANSDNGILAFIETVLPK